MSNPCAPILRRFERRWRHGTHRVVRHAAAPCPAPVKGGVAKALAHGLLGAGVLAGAGSAAAYVSVAWRPPPADAAPVDPVFGQTRTMPPVETELSGDGLGDGRDRPPQNVPEPMSLIIFAEALIGLAAARCLTRAW